MTHTLELSARERGSTLWRCWCGYAVRLWADGRIDIVRSLPHGAPAELTHVFPDGRPAVALPPRVRAWLEGLTMEGSDDDLR